MCIDCLHSPYKSTIHGSININHTWILYRLHSLSLNGLNALIFKLFGLVFVGEIETNGFVKGFGKGVTSRISTEYMESGVVVSAFIVAPPTRAHYTSRIEPH